MNVTPIWIFPCDLVKFCVCLLGLAAFVIKLFGSFTAVDKVPQ